MFKLLKFIIISHSITYLVNIGLQFRAQVEDGTDRMDKELRNRCGGKQIKSY
jgi:hypothetical protein